MSRPPLTLEWLVVFKRPSQSAPLGVDIEMIQVRRLSFDESVESKAANAFLMDLTGRGALQDVKGASEDLQTEIRVLKARDHTTNARTGSGWKLERTFKAWLSAFVSYIDRTQHWLSQECGRASSEYARFDHWRRKEFDANFAYRLCYGLRNASQHAGNVINGLEFSARELPDGSSEELVILHLECAALAERFTSIRSSTRQEMLKVTEPVELESIVAAVNNSCIRLHALVFEMLKDRVVEAIEIVRSHDAEVGGPVSFETSGWFDRTEPPERSQPSFRVNGGEFASAAHDGLREAERLASEQPQPEEFDWMDFACVGDHESA